PAPAPGAQSLRRKHLRDAARGGHAERRAAGPVPAVDLRHQRPGPRRLLRIDHSRRGPTGRAGAARHARGTVARPDLAPGGPLMTTTRKGSSGRRGLRVGLAGLLLVLEAATVLAPTPLAHAQSTMRDYPVPGG